MPMATLMPNYTRPLPQPLSFGEGLGERTIVVITSSFVFSCQHSCFLCGSLTSLRIFAV
jgi:hypothetical protein